MHCLALACDYDGTLATEGKVKVAVFRHLEQLRASGRKLILVTGRELEDLRAVFEPLEIFDRIVLENGALIYCPRTRVQRVLAEKPPASFVAALNERGVTPLTVGQVIVSTSESYEEDVVDVIREQGLDLQIILNKGSVMILRPGVNKESGLRTALQELAISHQNVVAIGDGENDHSLLSLCRFGVAVENAIPALKKCADWVTQNPEGEGVSEIIQQILKDDLQSLMNEYSILL